MGYWNKYQAAIHWGVTPEHARLLMRKMPEAKRVPNDRGSLEWMITEGTNKPTKTLKNRKGSK